MDNGVAFVTGRLTRDPLFFGEGEKRRVVFSIAFNRGRDERRKTTFIDCIAWGKRADILENFKKGSGVTVSGDLETDTFEKDGQKVSRLRLNIITITATTSNRRNEGEGEEGGEAETNVEAETPQRKASASSRKPAKSGETADLPF